jgi:hypothetical protein
VDRAEEKDATGGFLRASDAFSLHIAPPENAPARDAKPGTGGQFLDQAAARANGVVVPEDAHQGNVCTGAGRRIIEAGGKCRPDRCREYICRKKAGQDGPEHGFPFPPMGRYFVSMLLEGEQVGEFVEQGDQKSISV